jgi:hypothetical protein
MREIIDKILLYLGQELLTVKIEKAYGESDQGGEKGYAADDPEIHFFHYIFMPVGEVQQNMVVFPGKDG